jgi:PIN domain nuclease of toxin-antitoxin system
VSLLLDTHYVLALIGDDPPLGEPWATKRLFVSVASFWEIAIKARQGKLTTAVPPADLDEAVLSWGCSILPIDSVHVVEEVDPWPRTQDPFDRLLLAVCSVEGLKLVTRDRLLVDHPLAWRPASA